ncbi:Quercetin 2,3-dioxygenase [Legionella massiliensis]|uniref:Quercetin 2,3-dioxygenase n=1 Tax=Legionella massiliensis TaxID=1034943 RepID=A0A078KU35_9GAMM|nr:pirin family protein [Legionella massiliensis]CDZ76482.1 Quercetin 2,3-dioxygenase [Legionella massiliensis]CEE12220.1 Quercetin 2,3-dioxygenase [Legionella massiliensis]
MLTRRDRNERGPTMAGWLNSKHSFSFGHYYDPRQMGYGVLRVINEDKVIPGAGFGTHPHSNMEIISYVLKGQLAHKDSMGSGSIIKPGDVQLMSAGSGVTHSEYNASNEEEVHFLQIWIIPKVYDQKPRYQQRTFTPEDLHNQFRVVVSPDGEEGSLEIKQDARLFVGKFDAGNKTRIVLNPQLKYWLQVAQGTATVNGVKLVAGDGLAIAEEQRLESISESDSELLFFDLP